MKDNETIIEQQSSARKDLKEIVCSLAGKDIIYQTADIKKKHTREKSLK